MNEEQQYLERLKEARNFVYKCLDDKVVTMDRQDAFSYFVSFFVFYKESLIKKDFSSGEIHFNFAFNKKYYKIIKEFVDAFESIRGSVLNPNNLDVVIDNPPDVSPAQLEEIKAYILKFHKIRDSIAHGQYTPDYDRGILKIRNEQGSYNIQCDLPIQYLELFIKSFNDIGLGREIVTMEDYDSILKVPLDPLVADDLSSTLGLIDEIFLDEESLDEKDLNKKEMDEILKNNLFVDTFSHFSSVKLALDKKKNQNQFASNKFFKDLKEKLIDSLKKGNLSFIERLNAIAQLRDLNIDLLHYKRSIKLKGERYLDEFTYIVIELANLCNSSSPKAKMLVFASLYNYMQLFFSFNADTIKTKYETIKRKIGNLSSKQVDELSIVEKKILKSFGISFPLLSLLEIDIKTSDYTTTVKCINREVVKTLNSIVSDEGLVEKGYITPTEFQKKRFDALYKLKIYLKLKILELHMEVLRHIRNSIEHAHISPFSSDKLVFEDRNVSGPVSFRCCGSTDSFLSITHSLEKEKTLFTVTQQTEEQLEIEEVEEPGKDIFYDELSAVLDPELFEKLIAELEKDEPGIGHGYGL